MCIRDSVRTVHGSNVLVVIEGTTTGTSTSGPGDLIEIMYSSAGTATAPDNPGLDPTLWQENSSFSGLPVERTETNIFRLSYDEGDTGELSLNQFNFRDGTASTSTVFEGGWVTAGTNVFLRVRLDAAEQTALQSCLLYTSPSPRDS